MSTYFGKGEIARIKKICDTSNYKRVLLIRGTTSYTSSPAKAYFDSLAKELETQHFIANANNPSADEVKQALDQLNLFKPDVIIALGGGKVIDLAKSISCALHSGYETFVNSIITGTKVKTKHCPVIAIPTTAGTGSEATHFAVIYIDNKKYSLAGDVVKPDIALIDPSLSYSMSPALTAETGVDALSQAIESYWSVKSTPESRQYSLRAIPLIMENLPKAVSNPCDKSREAMCKASHFAGQAINLTTTTAPHALSYSLSAKLKIAHGHAVACTLAEFFVQNLSTNNIENKLHTELNKNEYKANAKQLLHAFNCDDGLSAATNIYKFLLQIGLETNLKKLGLAETDYYEIASSVNQQRLQNNPVLVDEKAIIEVLRQPNHSNY